MRGQVWETMSPAAVPKEAPTRFPLAASLSVKPVVPARLTTMWLRPSDRRLTALCSHPWV